jgi:hypothetical protein
MPSYASFNAFLGRVVNASIPGAAVFIDEKQGSLRENKNSVYFYRLALWLKFLCNKGRFISHY